MKRLIPFLCSLPLLSGIVTAQDEAPPKHLRFITLGERPVWKEELRDGIRVGLEPPKGSMPPKELSVLSGETNRIPFRANLQTMSEMVTISGETPQLLLKKGPLGTAQDWLRGKVPTSPLSLGVLFRDPANMTWDRPKMLLLKDSPSDFPAGKIRFVNTSDTMVILQIGDWRARNPPKIFGIPAGQVSIKDLKVGNNQMRVGYTEPNGTKRWIWSNQIRLLNNQRVQAYFYKAQGKTPRQKVLFHYTPEPLPRLPAPPRRDN